jgi:hypothetical protein
MGQRQHRLGRAAQGGGNARHDLDRQSGGAHRFDFLAAAAEHERVAPL